MLKPGDKVKVIANCTTLTKHEPTHIGERGKVAMTLDDDIVVVELASPNGTVTSISFFEDELEPA